MPRSVAVSTETRRRFRFNTWSETSTPHAVSRQPLRTIWPAREVLGSRRPKHWHRAPVIWMACARNPMLMTVAINVAPSWYSPKRRATPTRPSTIDKANSFDAGRSITFPMAAISKVTPTAVRSTTSRSGNSLRIPSDAQHCCIQQKPVQVLPQKSWFVPVQ